MKKLISIFIVLLLASFFVSCGGGFKISKKTDPAKPSTIIVSSTPIKIKGDLQMDQYVAYLEYFCYKTSEGDNYLFKIRYKGYQFVYLQNLKLTIRQSESIHEPTRRPIRSNEGVVGLYEEIMVPIPTEKIEEIIENRKCRMTVNGELLDIDLFLKQDWIDNLTQFFIEVNKKS